jgi:DNA mismatch endonuclease (patch repair protein)
LDVFAAAKRSDVMRRIRGKDTKPEIAIRHGLHALGFRFRIHDKRLPGKPDIVFGRNKIAVQVRGCFWHGHNCIDGRIPKSRAEYWIPKLTGNRSRDLRSDRALRKAGWKVVVVWECQCTNKKIVRQLMRIAKAITIRNPDATFTG